MRSGVWRVARGATSWLLARGRARRTARGQSKGLLMELIIDTADLDEIKKLDALLNVDGVTTNPTIITRSGKTPEVVIPEIIEYLRPDQKLFIQVVAEDYDGIMEEARYINGLRPENTYAKIPVTRDGLKAVRDAHNEGLGVLATAIFSPESAFLAALNGADYLAPYVNRMSNYGDGIQQVADLIEMLAVQGLDTKVMAASLHNTNQVHELILAGIQAITFPPAILNSMIDQPGTVGAVHDFTASWEKNYGRTTLRA